MGISLPGGLSEAMGLMGVEFPGTDEDALTAAAEQWRQIANRCEAWASDLSGAVNHISSTNDNAASSAFVSYANGKSNVTGMQALGSNAQAIASGYDRAASAVRGLKATYIGTASAVQAYLLVLRASPAPDADAASEFINRCANLLRQADAKTASAIAKG